VSRRTKLWLGISWRITRNDVDGMAKDAGETAREFIEVEADIERERGHSIAARVVDERVKEIETKVADHLSSHLEADLEKFLRSVLALFTFEERRSALLAVLTAEGAAPAALRWVKKTFVEEERGLDRIVLGERRKLPRGAPTGRRKSTTETADYVRKLYAREKELAKQRGEPSGKSKILPLIAERVSLSEDAVDALIWPRATM
jgi:hypothetical protein